MKLETLIGAKAWLIVIPLLINNMAYAQVRFSEFYDINLGSDALVSVAETADGNLIAVGSSLNLTDNVNHYDAPHVVIDETGLLINSARLTQQEHSYKTNAVIKSRYSNALYASGYMCDYTVESPGYCDLLFLRLNQLGDTVFTKLIERPDTTDILLNMVETRPNRIMLIGWTYDDTTNADADLLFITVDTLGNEVNRVVYGGGGADYAHSGTVINESGDVFMTGYTASFQGSDNDTWLIKTDSVGNVQWHMTYNHISPSGGESAAAVLGLPDGNYALVGGAKNSTTSNFDGVLMKIDLAGGVIWTKRYGTQNGTQSFLDGIVLQNGNMLACGQTTNTNDGSQAGWLIKTDENGDTLWTRVYNPSPYTDLLRNMMLMPNGDIVMVGFGRDSGQVNQDGWILRVDSMGCEIENCFLTSVNEELPFGTAQGTFTVYPNPANDVVRFKVLDSSSRSSVGMTGRVFDGAGRRVYDETLPSAQGNSFSIDVSTWPSGVYVVQVVDGSGNVRSAKFIRR